MRQKSYDETPTLFLIPTPIGNMKDMTYRAIETLKEVSVVFSEDTRVTANLFKYFDIKNKLISNHEHNEEFNKKKLIEYLRSGNNVGLVSDRGTPVISDPGFELARHAINEGFNVVSLPGATALIPALTSSGLSPQPFTFVGFLNNKEGKRKKELEKYKEIDNTIIFYESPHRILKTIKNILEIMGDRNISISREITKKYEEIIRGKASEILEAVEALKGEMVVVVEKAENKPRDFSELSVIDHVNKFIKEGLTSKEAIKKVSKERNVPKSEIYNEFHSERK